MASRSFGMAGQVVDRDEQRGARRALARLLVARAAGHPRRERRRSTSSSTASTRPSSAAARHEQTALPAEGHVGLDETAGEHAPRRAVPLRQVVLDLAPGLALRGQLAVEPVAARSIASRSASAVSSWRSCTTRSVPSQPWRDTGLGQRLRHLGVDVDRPRAQVVDDLLLLGELERVDVVTRIWRCALPFDRLAGLVVVAAAGVGGHRGTLPAPRAVSRLPATPALVSTNHECTSDQ